MLSFTSLSDRPLISKFLNVKEPFVLNDMLFWIFAEKFSLLSRFMRKLDCSLNLNYN